MHVESVLERMKRRFGVEVDLHKPHVPYRETITRPAEGHHRHKKQTGGAGQFGEVYLRVEPLARGTGFEFVDDVKGGAIPNQFIPAVEKGIRHALVAGAVAEMFGLKWQAMIQGLAFMSHQVGSFLGAFGGGMLYDALGSYTMAWRIGVALGLAGGIIQVAFALIRPSQPPQMQTA